MIFKALKQSNTGGDVRLMILKDVRIPLKTVIDSGSFPIEKADLQMDSLSVSVRARAGVFRNVPMRLDTAPKEDFGKPGILVAKNTALATEYLVRHWVCGGAPIIDAAVTAARVARDAGQSFLHMVQQFANPERQRHGWHDDNPESDGFIWPQEQFDFEFSRVGGKALRTFTVDRPRGESAMAAVLVPRNREFGGHVIRGWDVLTFGGESDNRIVIVSTPEGWQSGPLRRIDQETLARFETRGRMIAIGQTDLSAWQNWVVPAIVRVPAAGTRPGAEQDPDIVREFPVARLADARLPLAFTRDVQVIADPAAALDILCRASRGYVLAGLGGDVLPANLHRLAGRWLAVCVPALWVEQSCRAGGPLFGVKDAQAGAGFVRDVVIGAA